MVGRPKCWICEGEFASPWPTSGDRTTVDCKTCGKYEISNSLSASKFPLPDSERYRMSFWCKRRQLEGREAPMFSEHTIAATVAQLPNPAAHEKPDVLLASLTLLYPNPGTGFTIDGFRERSLACARDERDFVFFIEALERRGHIEKRAGSSFRIQLAGWERAGQVVAQPETSRTAFVAMKFNDEMLGLWKSAFVPAVERARFQPRLANEPQHNEQIDAHIIAELKQSRFVIADVTFASPGVYFEAGYALGMGRRLIWTCREDRHTTDMHFDSRQYNHILWKTAADLTEQLYYRIVATI